MFLDPKDAVQRCQVRLACATAQLEIRVKPAYRGQRPLQGMIAETY